MKTWTEEEIQRVTHERISGLKAKKATGQKLSKYAEWVLRHPNGLKGAKILDYKAAMR
jgi:hypothetical protein